MRTDPSRANVSRALSGVPHSARRMATSALRSWPRRSASGMSQAVSGPLPVYTAASVAWAHGKCTPSACGPESATLLQPRLEGAA